MIALFHVYLRLETNSILDFTKRIGNTHGNIDNQIIGTSIFIISVYLYLYRCHFNTHSRRHVLIFDHISVVPGSIWTFFTVFPICPMFVSNSVRFAEVRFLGCCHPC